MGVGIIDLTGGEPLLYYKFKDILNYCLGIFKGVSLITNGTLIDEEIADIINENKDKCLIQIDLDGPTAKIHDTIRGHGSFYKAIAAIKLLSKHTIKTRVAMNVLSETVDKIEATADLAYSLGTTWFGSSPIDALGRGRNLNLTFNNESLLQMIRDIPYRIEKKYPEFIKWSQQQTILKQKENENNCGAGWRSFVLGPTGTIRPCPMLPEEYLTIGNIKNNSLNNIFKNTMILFLHNLQSPRDDICGECKKDHNCGYCFARAIFNQEKLNKECAWSIKTGFSKYWTPKQTIDNNTSKSTICSELLRPYGRSSSLIL